MPNREEVLYQDFSARLRPRMFHASTDGATYVRYAKEPKKFHQPTDAEISAAGRKVRRRTNKKLRGWHPYAQR